MSRFNYILLAASLLFVAACAQPEPPETEVTKSMAVMKMPVTTTSEDAREHYLVGWYAADMGRGIDALEHFEKAVEADPNFAVGYLAVANTSNSVAGFTANLAKAEANAANASKAEQLRIEVVRKGFDNDREGQMAAAKALTAEVPDSPRAWALLAGLQSGMKQHAESRESIGKAMELAPNWAAAHMQAANNYLFGEPMNLDEALAHAEAAVAAAPEEAAPHDILGDVLRRQGNLEAARDAYTEAAEYSGPDGSPYQQRAHVNSFLGDYAAARADYDKSISMARANQAPSFSVFKALVSVHEGKPDAAIDELVAVASQIDQSNIPEPTGLKLFALGSAYNIALHTGKANRAETLLKQWAELMRRQGEQVGTEPFKRGQEAAIAYNEAMLAVEKKEFRKAESKAAEVAKLREPDANPRKMEAVHEIRGVIALERKNYQKAVDELSQGNHLNNIYIRYQLAQALEGAGQKERANEIYNGLANWNFNGVGYALIRKDAMAKAGASSAA